MRVGRLVYWFVAGACFGLGLDIYALGTLCLAGVILLVVGGVALRGREVVATVLGLGVGFAAVLPLVAYTPFRGGGAICAAGLCGPRRLQPHLGRLGGPGRRVAHPAARRWPNRQLGVQRNGGGSSWHILVCRSPSASTRRLRRLTAIAYCRCEHCAGSRSTSC